MTLRSAHVDSAAQGNALHAAARAMREESTDQEHPGGACSKTRAARNGDSTHGRPRTGTLERCTVVVGAISSGAAVP